MGSESEFAVPRAWVGGELQSASYYDGVRGGDPRPVGVCPFCGAKVDLRICEAKRIHWTHRSGEQCAEQTEGGHSLSGGESRVHREAKVDVMRGLQRNPGVALPLLLRCGPPQSGQLSLGLTTDPARYRSPCDAEHRVEIMGWDDVKLEHPLFGREGLRLDLALLREGRVVLGIEICAKHPVDEEKAARLDLAGIPWVEVDVRDGDANRWWKDWSPSGGLAVVQGSSRFDWRCHEHKLVRGIELTSLLDLYFPAKGEGEPARARLPLVGVSAYRLDEFVQRELHAWTGSRQARLAVVAGDDRAGFTEATKKTVAWMKAWLPDGVILDSASSWLPVAHVAAPARIELMRQRAGDLERFPFRYAWRDGSWERVHGSLPGDERCVDLWKTDAVVSGMAAYVTNSELAHAPRKPHAGLPPTWSREAEAELEGFDAAETLGWCLHELARPDSELRKHLGADDDMPTTPEDWADLIAGSDEPVGPRRKEWLRKLLVAARDRAATGE
jgi:hypothetical protein